MNGSEKDKAFGEGQRAAWDGTPRFNNPHTDRTLQRLWWGGWDSANRAKAMQNTKAIGKY
jgi:hypothetical protein